MSDFDCIGYITSPVVMVLGFLILFDGGIKAIGIGIGIVLCGIALFLLSFYLSHNMSWNDDIRGIS